MESETFTNSDCPTLGCVALMETKRRRPLGPATDAFVLALKMVAELLDVDLLGVLDEDAVELDVMPDVKLLAGTADGFNSKASPTTRAPTKSAPNAIHRLCSNALQL